MSFSAQPGWSEEGQDLHGTLSGRAGAKAPGSLGLPVRRWGSSSVQWGGAQPGRQWHAPLWLHTWGGLGVRPEAAACLSATLSVQRVASRASPSGGFLWAVLGAHPQTSLRRGSEGSPSPGVSRSQRLTVPTSCHATDAERFQVCPGPAHASTGTTAPGLGVHMGHPDATSLWQRPLRGLGSSRARPTGLLQPRRARGGTPRGLTYPVAVALGRAVLGSVNAQVPAKSFPANLEGRGDPLRPAF